MLKVSSAMAHPEIMVDGNRPLNMRVGVSLNYQCIRTTANAFGRSKVLNFSMITVFAMAQD